MYRQAASYVGLEPGGKKKLREGKKIYFTFVGQDTIHLSWLLRCRQVPFGESSGTGSGFLVSGVLTRIFPPKSGNRFGWAGTE